MRRFAGLLGVIALTLTVLPWGVGEAGSPEMSSEETVLTMKGGEVRIFDQVTLARHATAELTWPLARGAKDVSARGATLLATRGYFVRLTPHQKTFVLTYAVPVSGSSFIWTREVTDPPAEWAVLIGPTLRPGFLKGLPFREVGTVRLAGEDLTEFAANPISGPMSFDWPFLASPWPNFLSGALWFLAGLLIVTGAYLAVIRSGWRPAGGDARPAVGGADKA